MLSYLRNGNNSNDKMNIFKINKKRKIYPMNNFNNITNYNRPQRHLLKSNIINKHNIANNYLLKYNNKYSKKELKYKRLEYEKVNWICEHDRIRLQNFINNPWIYEIINKKNSRNNFSKEFNNILELEINNKLINYKKLQLIFKDIRYCFYKFYGNTTNLKYSNNKDINIIFSKIYPFLNSEEIYQATNNYYNIDYNISNNNIIKNNNNTSKADNNNNSKINYNNVLYTYDDLKNNNFNKFKTIIYFLIEKSELLQLPINKIIEFNIYNQKPYFNIKSFYAFNLVKKGDNNKLYNLIKENNKIIYDINNKGQTLLHYAVINQNITAIKNILTFFPDINKLDYKLKTPIDYAVIKNNSKIIKLLLKNRSYPYSKYIKNNNMNKLFRLYLKLNLKLLPVSNKNKWIYWTALIKKVNKIN